MQPIDLEQEDMLGLAKRYHAAQMRAGNAPYWQHVLSVAQILQNAYAESGELNDDPALLKDILLAALAHDLYEDTEARREEIAEKFGERVDELAWQLTNENGDDDRDAYVAKIAAAPEEAKLIKLADLIENSISVAYNIDELGTKWAHSFFLPIVEEMRPMVGLEKFSRYPATAAILAGQLSFATQRLHENVRKFETVR